jgi:hypothetical protein
MRELREKEWNDLLRANPNFEHFDEVGTAVRGRSELVLGKLQSRAAGVRCRRDRFNFNKEFAIYGGAQKIESETIAAAS